MKSFFGGHFKISDWQKSKVCREQSNGKWLSNEHDSVVSKIWYLMLDKNGCKEMTIAQVTL